MVCERCNEIVGPEDAFCPTCGVCIKVERCRRGRDALIAIFVILVVYPSLRSIHFFGVSILNKTPVSAMLLVDTFLLVTLGFLFYRAFRGDRRIKIPIVLLIISIGMFRVLAALVITLLLNPLSSLLGWMITGGVEIALGIFIFKSIDIEAYIVSRTERERFGR